ncbi:MAG: hypothetical protein R2688_08385 [Fimbriimonadaceae bacterium]
MSAKMIFAMILAMSAYQLILQKHFPGRKIWATIIALSATDSRA